MFPNGYNGVLTGASLVFFAYIGFDTVTVASEEARRPARDVPIAILVSLAIGAVLYVAIAWVTVGVVPWRHISENAGMSDAVVAAGNNHLLAAILFAGAFAGTTTIMLTSLLGQIRIFYVMARDRMLPAFVARVNARTRTPVVTTLVTGTIVAILAAGVPLDVLLALVNIGTLSAFAIVCVGVLALRFTRPDAARPFRVPFGPASPSPSALVPRVDGRPLARNLDPVRGLVRSRDGGLCLLRLSHVALAPRRRRGRVAAQRSASLPKRNRTRSPRATRYFAGAGESAGDGEPAGAARPASKSCARLSNAFAGVSKAEGTLSPPDSSVICAPAAFWSGPGSLARSR